MARIALGPDENRRRLTAQVGDTVVVRLPERRTAGYRWRPEVNEEALEVLDDQYLPPESLHGAPATKMMTFALRRAGAVQLRVVSARSWDHAAPAAEEYVVDFDVASSQEG